MKRLRPSAVLVLLVALVAFVPIGAQTPAKRAFDLEDILAFRALGVTTLSANGQWVAYRLSPLQGDSEVVVRSTSGDKEMRFPVGEGAGGAATFSADSTWIAITTALTRREAEAARRARRPVQTSVTIVNLASGDKVNIPKIRRFEFAGETAGLDRAASVRSGRRRRRRSRRSRPGAVEGDEVAARRTPTHRATRVPAAPTSSFESSRAASRSTSATSRSSRSTSPASRWRC